MRAFSVVVVMVLCLCTGALGVQVTVEGRHFQLSDVKELKKLVNLGETTPKLTQENVKAVCADAGLPAAFQPVCRAKEGLDVFSKLVSIPLDICEICAFPACTGC